MRIKAGLLLLVIVSLIAGAIYFIPRNIFINNISCENQFGRCSESIDNKLNEVSGKNLVEAKKQIGDSLSAEPLVSDYSTHYKIPDRLEVNILLRKPHFGIKFETSDVIALIDNEGYVISFEEETSLPVLFSKEPPPQVGEKVGEMQLFSLKLLKDMYEYYQTKEAQVVEDGIYFDLEKGREAIFPREGDRQILIASLAVILTRLNAEDSSTRIENVEGLQSACTGGCTIDLRYKNPVIR